MFSSKRECSGLHVGIPAFGNRSAVLIAVAFKAQKPSNLKCIVL